VNRFPSDLTNKVARCGHCRTPIQSAPPATGHDPQVFCSGPSAAATKSEPLTFRDYVQIGVGILIIGAILNLVTFAKEGHPYLRRATAAAKSAYTAWREQRTRPTVVHVRDDFSYEVDALRRQIRRMETEPRSTTIIDSATSRITFCTDTNNNSVVCHTP
jgi:hypothetical protein